MKDLTDAEIARRENDHARRSRNTGRRGGRRRRSAQYRPQVCVAKCKSDACRRDGLRAHNGYCAECGAQMAAMTAVTEGAEG